MTPDMLGFPILFIIHRMQSTGYKTAIQINTIVDKRKAHAE